VSRRIRIAPSILAADFGRLAEETRAATRAGADWIHVDVMDGHFVPNLTLGPVVVRALRSATELPLDVHLMIEAPERSLEQYAEAGADRIGVHVETCPHIHRTLQQIRGLGKKACAVLNPGTPAVAVEPVLGDLDQVLVMSVNPGFGGQKFIESVLPKVATLRRWIDERELDVALEIDGGIGPGTAGRAAAAGADVFVAGTAVFREPDYQAAIAALRKEAEGAVPAPDRRPA
jgi:ribulose-phosphate 3-epimerase